MPPPDLTDEPTDEPTDLRASLDAALAELAAATGRLLASAGKLTDSSIAGPSRLPGWTRGHVITHLARNADAMAGLLLGLADGQEVAMYASAAARDHEIEAGAGRPAAEQLADLETSAAGFAAAARALPATVLGGLVYVGLGRIPVRGADAPLLRVREVQIHHVDLGVGFAPDDWPNVFCTRTLDQLTPFFREQRTMPLGRLVDPALDRAWIVADTGPDLSGAASMLAAWLVGRSTGPDLEMSDRTAVPSAPAWV